MLEVKTLVYWYPEMTYYVFFATFFKIVTNTFFNFRNFEYNKHTSIFIYIDLHLFIPTLLKLDQLVGQSQPWSEQFKLSWQICICILTLKTFESKAWNGILNSSLLQSLLGAYLDTGLDYFLPLCTKGKKLLFKWSCVFVCVVEISLLSCFFFSK